MKYFGCIEQKMFEGLSSDQQLKYLQAKGIYRGINIFNIPLDGTKADFRESKAESKKIVPNQMVKDEFYRFVAQQFKPFIDNTYYSLYQLFNEDKYGLKKSKQKQVALEHFKTNYDAIATKQVAVFYEKISKSGDTVLENMNKLNFLDTGRNALKSDLSKTVLLQQFLFGNKDFFVAELVSKHKILRSIIKFEGTYKILSSLNSQYHFEGKAVTQPNEPNKTNPKTQENQPSQALESSKSSLFDENSPNFNKKTLDRPPLISDEEAIEYLLKSIFRKKK